MSVSSNGICDGDTCDPVKLILKDYEVTHARSVAAAVSAGYVPGHPSRDVRIFFSPR